MNEKELRDVYNFYKDCKDGFVTKDGYAAVPIIGAKSLMVVYNGEQLQECKTKRSAQTFIKNHRTQAKSGTVFVEN
jgi:hypothetical protein